VKEKEELGKYRKRHTGWKGRDGNGRDGRQRACSATQDVVNLRRTAISFGTEDTQLSKCRSVVFELYERSEETKNKQANKHVHHNTSFPLLGVGGGAN